MQSVPLSPFGVKRLVPSASVAGKEDSQATPTGSAVVESPKFRASPSQGPEQNGPAIGKFQAPVVADEEAEADMGSGVKRPHVEAGLTFDKRARTAQVGAPPSQMSNSEVVLKVKLEQDSDTELPAAKSMPEASTLERWPPSCASSSMHVEGEGLDRPKDEGKAGPVRMKNEPVQRQEQCRRRLARKTSSEMWTVKEEPPDGVNAAVEMDWRARIQQTLEMASRAFEDCQARARMRLKHEAKDEMLLETKQEIKNEVKEEVKEEEEEYDLMDELKHEVKDELKHEVKDELKHEVEDEELKHEVKDELKHEVKDELKHELKDEFQAEVKCEIKFEAKHAIKSEVSNEMKPGLMTEELENGVMQELPDEVLKKLEEEFETAVKEEMRESGTTSKAKQRIRCKQSLAKRECKQEPQDQRAQWSWTKADPSTTFAARLPWFIAQCRAFQIVRRTWSPARPCCLPNSYIQPLAPPNGQACYERLNKEERRQFRNYVEKIEASGRMKRTRFNTHFLDLLHPETRVVAPRARSGLPYERLLVTPPEMKMWPWMRDLDVRWWIGRGWILTPDGPKRVVANGAAPGTEIFQGKGLSKHREPEDEEAKASSSAVPQPAPMDATPATEGSQQGKCVIHVPAKRSGVKGVSWFSNHNCWDAAWCEGAKVKHRRFFVHRYMESTGKGYQEADAEALRDAIAFRESLVKDGVIVEAASASRQAGKRGVCWSHGSWQVIISVNSKRIYGGKFRPKDDTPEEIERARLAAVERRRELELEHFQIQRREAVDPSEMQKKRESGVTGVFWNCRGLYWRSKATVFGKEVKKDFPPKDMSDESIEAARLQAIQHRRDLERLRDASKASS